MRILNVFITIAACLICLNGAYAAPAWPNKISYTQADGTKVTVYLNGDEYMHHYVSEDGFILLPDANGSLRYAEIVDNKVVPTGMVAHNATSRNAKELQFIKTLDQQTIKQKLAIAYRDKRQEIASKAQRVKSQSSPSVIEPVFPTIGNIRGLIILAQFKDQKFSTDNIHDIYNSMANDEDYSGPYASGSIKSYFTAQSAGKFVPTFDIVGPVDLPHEMAYYGYDERAAELMIDACSMADANTDVDFSKYDYNGDGYVDFIFVVYAGYGQSQGGSEETVWPQAVDLTYESWNMYDGLYLGQAACSCELRGHEGTTLDGIGTFCHEFSHILGLPDIYDAAYSGMQGMLTWDVMCNGLYNDDSKTPAGYTAMDKYTVGWLEPVVLSEPAKDLTLNPLSESNEAYFIVCGTDNNEYFTLENRQQTGWDKALDGHGLIISQIHYVPSLWNTNRVNTSSSGYEHVSLIPADGHASDGTEAGDPFPGTSNNTQFTDTSMPSAKWHTTSDAVNCPITNIRENNGVITFDFKSDATGIESHEAGQELARISTTGGTINIDNPQKSDVLILSADGRIIQKSAQRHITCTPGCGMYIVKCGELIKKVILARP